VVALDRRPVRARAAGAGGAATASLPLITASPARPQAGNAPSMSTRPHRRDRRPIDISATNAPRWRSAPPLRSPSIRPAPPEGAPRGARPARSQFASQTPHVAHVRYPEGDEISAPAPRSRPAPRRRAARSRSDRPRRAIGAPARSPGARRAAHLARLRRGALGALPRASCSASACRVADTVTTASIRCSRRSWYRAPPVTGTNW
jgi:hypothetical protein